MARLERPTVKSSNPAKRFLEWKSNDKAFSYYDKDKEENVTVELPLKVLFMEHYHTVKGWHDASASGIYANEVFLIGSEPMTVKAFKGGEIASGLYKDIKPKVNAAGGKYHRSIYAMTESGDLINISLKGASVGGIKRDKAVDKKDHPGYSDFASDNSTKLDDHWIVIDGAAEGKSGSVKYSIPTFAIGERIKPAIDSKANEVADELQTYMKDYVSESTAFDGDRSNSEVDKYQETASVDDLEF